MFKYMTIVLIALSLVPTVYYYFLFRRIEKTLGFDITKPLWIAARILLTLIAWHFMSQITSPVAIFLYSILLLDILILLINFIIKRITGKTNEEAGRKGWAKIAGLSMIPVIVVTVSFIVGGIIIRNVVETRYTVTTDKEIPEEGFRICFFSDVHCGNALKSEDYERISREIESKNVDAVIMGGDLIDFKSEQKVVEDMFASFGSISTTRGVYYVFGNHDRVGDYKESVFTQQYILDLCKKNGIIVLQDEHEDLGNGIVLLGREDSSPEDDRERKSAAEVLADVDKDSFTVVADHNPSEYPQLAAAGADLVLSGHLHGGQVWPVNIIIRIIHPQHIVSGRYLITPDKVMRAESIGPAREGEGTATGIVTDGLVGWSYPIRTCGHSEYCMIDLKKQ